MKAANRHYRISPSLLNSITGYLNAGELWESFWGKSDNPPYTPEEFEKKQLDELLAYINKEPQEPNEAADRGTCLNEIVDVLIGAEPRADVKISRYNGEVQAWKDPFEFAFANELVDALVEVYKDALPQYHLQHTYTLNSGDQVTLHGFADYIFPTCIWDMKTTTKYDYGKYENNWQRKVYPIVAIDSGAMTSCDHFTFDVLVCSEKKGAITAKNYREWYDVNVDDFRAEVLSFLEVRVIPMLDKWLSDGLIDNNQIITML